MTVSGHKAEGSTWKSAAVWRHWRTTLVLRFGFAHLSRVTSTCPDASVSASPNLLHVRGNKFWRPLKIYFSIPNLIISSGNGTVPTKWRLLTLLVSYQGSKNHIGNWQSMNYNREQMNIRWKYVHCSDGAPIAINLVMTVGDHYHKYNTNLWLSVSSLQGVIFVLWEVFHSRVSLEKSPIYDGGTWG